MEGKILEVTYIGISKANTILINYVHFIWGSHTSSELVCLLDFRYKTFSTQCRKTQAKSLVFSHICVKKITFYSESEIFKFVPNRTKKILTMF